MTILKKIGNRLDQETCKKIISHSGKIVIWEFDNITNNFRISDQRTLDEKMTNPIPNKMIALYFGLNDLVIKSKFSHEFLKKFNTVNINLN